MEKNHLNQLQAEIEQIRNDDFISRAVYKFKILPWQGALIIILINLILSIMLGYLTQTLLPEGGRRGFLNDYPTWAFEFILHPVIIGGFVWTQRSIRNLYQELLVQEKLIEPSNCIATVQKYKKYLQNKIFYRLVGIFSFFAGLFTVYVFSNQVNQSWLARSVILAFSRGPIYFTIVYTASIAVYSLLLAFFTLNSLLKNNKVEIKIFHADNTGGIGALGRYVSNLGYLLGGVALTFAISSLYDIGSLYGANGYIDYIQIGYNVIFIIIAPVIFVTPLLSAHNAMKKYKENSVNKISIQLNSLLEQIMTGTIKDDEIENTFERIKKLEHIKEAVDRLPVWPVDIYGVRKFFSLSLSPILPTLVGFIFDVIKKVELKFP